MQVLSKIVNSPHKTDLSLPSYSILSSFGSNSPEDDSHDITQESPIQRSSLCSSSVRKQISPKATHRRSSSLISISFRRHVTKDWEQVIARIHKFAITISTISTISIKHSNCLIGLHIVPNVCEDVYHHKVQSRGRLQWYPTDGEDNYHSNVQLSGLHFQSHNRHRRRSRRRTFSCELKIQLLRLWLN